MFDGIWQEKEYFINNENRKTAVKEFVENNTVDDYMFSVVSLSYAAKEESFLVRNYLNQILRLINKELKVNL